MLKKLSLVLSVLAALGFAVATSAPADAAQPKNKVVRTNRTINVRTNRAVGVNRAVRGNFVVGRRYGGHVWYGHNRHRWHGQW